jgi:hypothetical protein
MASEHVVRYIDLEPSQATRLQIAVTVEDGRAVDPHRIDLPAWLAISCVRDPALGERHILCSLSDDGRPIDFAQRLSLDEAMAEVGAVIGRSSWRTCSLELDDNWERIPRQSVA